MNRDNASIVAIIDDDDEVREVLRGLLESEGHTVETFKSGQDFLDNAVLETTACLVVDQRMPGMSGLELLPKAKSMRPEVPVIMITAYGDAETKRRALESGAEALLTKPIDFGTLRSEIAMRVERAV